VEPVPAEGLIQLGDPGDAGDEDAQLLFDAELEREAGHGAAAARAGEANLHLAFIRYGDQLDFAAMGSCVALDIGHGAGDGLIKRSRLFRLDLLAAE